MNVRMPFTGVSQYRLRSAGTNQLRTNSAQQPLAIYRVVTKTDRLWDSGAGPLSHRCSSCAFYVIIITHHHLSSSSSIFVFILDVVVL